MNDFRRKARWEKPSVRECMHDRGLTFSGGTIINIQTGERGGRVDRFWSCLGCSMPINIETMKVLQFVSSKDETRSGIWKELK